MTEVPLFLAEIAGLPGVRAAFVERVPGIDVKGEKDAVLARLATAHRQEVERLGFSPEDLWLAEQVHGKGVAAVPAAYEQKRAPGADALVTAEPGVLLGIHVADCGAVFVVDRGRTRALGLVHSGKKGTEANILGETIATMKRRFNSRAEDLVVALAPCIRPPAYEVDFAAEIRNQALAAGVRAECFHDSGVCTSSDPERFYSYRMEKGKTGRMLALLGRLPQ